MQTPLLLVGKVEGARWTGWAIDYCSHGQPVPFDQISGDAECISHGGELYASTLVRPRQPGGKLVSRSLSIAFPAHALLEYYSRRHYLVLQPSPADFAAATGIQFIAATRDSYDSNQRCLTENGYGHTDWRQCPDPDFHEHNSDRCLPVAEWLQHYGPATEG